MAIVILGGLLTSTVLNIFIVPIVFYLTYHNRIKNEQLRKFKSCNNY